MADQGQWFKLWCSAVDDPDLSGLSNEDFGRWCKLGMMLKRHGNKGILVVKLPALGLQHLFRVTSYEEVVMILQKFPNCDVTEREPNASISVTVPNRFIIITWLNWSKYQSDNSYERVKKYREMKRSKKRREEKREEEKRNTPVVPLAGTGLFEKFWQAYPRKKSRATAERAFAKAATSEATLATMLDALNRLAPEWATRPPDKIPYPATWLNAQGWLDEPTLVGQQSQSKDDKCPDCKQAWRVHLAFARSDGSFCPQGAA